MKKYIPSLKHIFEATDQLIHSIEFLERHRMNENAFTRNRKMSFASIIKYLLTLPEYPLHTGLSKFFKHYFPKKDFIFSKQAFSKQRQNISSEAFRELFLMSTKFESCSKQPLWKGHSIYAIDGTTLQLPNSKINRDHFGYSSNQHEEPLAMARASALFNILEDRITDVVIDSYYSSERTHALQLIGAFVHTNAPRQPIILLDRGYPSRELFYSLMEKNMHFVMRAPSNSLQSINEVPEGDHFVHDAYHNFPLLLRVIKITLPNGTRETLVTNLYDQSYTIPMFIDLYFMRWAVESKYNELKNRLYIENFTGRKPEAVLQDFYATLFISNVVSMFKEVVDDEITEVNKHKNLKYEYQCTRNFLIDCIITDLLALIEYSKIRKSKLIKIIISQSKRNRSEIRPNRSSERKTKHPNSKYASTNYKHSF